MKRNFNIIFFLFFIISVNCQLIKPEFSLPSSNALELGKFGKTPVNLFNGAINPNISIYTIKQGKLTLPINVSYYGCGVKVDRHPTWVGLNWNLNAGGVITRVVRDLPDDYDCPNSLQVYDAPFSFMREYLSSIGANTTGGTKAGYLFKNENNSEEERRALSNGVDYYIDWLVSKKKYILDTEPDEFFFNFNGITGIFYLSESGQWKVQSDYNVKIKDYHITSIPNDIDILNNQSFMSNILSEFDGPFASCILSINFLNSQRYHLTSFTLVTDDGVEYTFGSNGVNKEGVEYSIPFHEQLTDSWTTMAWYLTEIKSPNGDKIILNYETDDYTANFYLSFLSKFETLTVDDPLLTYNCSFFNSDPMRYNGQIVFGNDYTNPRFAPVVGSLIRSQYLSSIITENETVTFNRTNSFELGYNNATYFGNQMLGIMKLVNGSFIESTCANILTQCPFVYLFAKNPQMQNAASEIKWKRLINISVSGNEFNTIFKFNYNNIQNERLMLKSIIQYDENNNKISDGYRFEYYDNPTITLPDYLSESSDHWGYNNGNTNHVIGDIYRYIPQIFPVDFYETKGDELYLSREPTNNLDIAQEGSLSSIYYPTGGYTRYEYEMHDFSKLFDITSETKIINYNQINKRAGGLRIRRISDYVDSQDQNPKVKEYVYRENYDNQDFPLVSTGILGNKSEYYISGLSTKSDETNVNTFFSSLSYSSISPLTQNSNGTHIGYSEIVEKNSNEGFTIYKFTNYLSCDGTHYDEYPTSYSNFLTSHTVYTDLSLERGRLIQKNIYNNTKKLLRSDITEYARVINPQSEVRGIYLSATIHYCKALYGLLNKKAISFIGVPYYHKTYKYLPVKNSVFVFDNNIISKIKEFTYNNKTFLVTKVVERDSYNNTIKTLFTYPSDVITYPLNGDYTSTNTEPLNSICSQMYLNNFINFPVETTTYKNEKVVKSVFVEYLKHQNDFLPKAIYRIEASSPITNFLRCSSSCQTKDSHYESTPTQEFLYDARSNVIQITEKTKFSIAFLWSYKYQYPIVEVKNSTHSQLINSLTPNLLLNLITYPNYPTDEMINAMSNNLKNNLPQAEVTTYTYKPLVGMTSKTDSRGVKTYYEYDEFNRLKYIKDTYGNIIQKFDYHYKE